jgi:arylsulfatase A-like enzyme
MSLYGYERETTPNLERMASELVVFEESWSQSSWTRPSVATLLSGLYPAQHGARLVFDALSEYVETLPEILRAHGYSTAAFSTNDCIARPAFNYNQGYDLFVDEKYALADKLRRDTIDWIDSTRQTGRPFLAYVHTWEAHGPYIAPGRFADLFVGDYDGHLKNWPVLVGKRLEAYGEFSAEDVAYVRARYDGEIAYSDEVLGRLERDLKSRDLWDNTLIVITSDHGEELYERGGWDHAHSLQPERIAVPLIIKLPGGRFGGKRVTGLAGGIDVLPTVLSALGIEPPESLPGIDLLAEAEATGHTGRDHHFAEFWPAEGQERGDPSFALIRDGLLLSRERSLILDGAELHMYRQDAPFEEQRNLALVEPETFLRYAPELREKYDHCYTVRAHSPSDKKHRIAGTITSAAYISWLGATFLDEDDHVNLDRGSRIVFDIMVSGEKNQFSFQTLPPHSAVIVTLNRDATEGETPLFLGSDAEPAEENPAGIPVSVSPADMLLHDPLPVTDDSPAGLYIWRKGVKQAIKDTGASKPESDAIDNLRDFGYL